ncbi:MAG: YodC family protein [Bacteroidia bacterium]
MAHSFNIGDKVRLKSGSDVMTVESFKDDQIYCVWYINNEFSRNSFPAATLVLVP